MTDHICTIHGAPCRGRESQKDWGKVVDLTAEEQAALTARANAAAAFVAEELVRQRTVTA